MDRLILDEAIAYEKKDSEPCSILCTHATNRNECIECRAYHKQLHKWLEELKMLRELKDEHRKIGNIEGFNQGYRKSIDDLIEKCENSKFSESDEISLSDIHTGVNSGLSMAIHFAEQLKEGGTDE